MGADEKLASVIDGESLINDGSALVIFNVLQQFVQGAQLGPSEVRLLACCARVKRRRGALGGALRARDVRSSRPAPHRAPQIVASFCRLALLGAAVGVAFGIVTSAWLGRIVREPTLEVRCFGCAHVLL